MAFGEAALQALGDPLQWVIIVVLSVLIVLAIVYVLLRVIRTLNKADKYFDSKEKRESTRLA
jgi:uncharacterized protein HemY